MQAAYIDGRHVRPVDSLALDQVDRGRRQDYSSPSAHLIKSAAQINRRGAPAAPAQRPCAGWSLAQAGLKTKTEN
jgi:hypothetical protein